MANSMTAYMKSHIFDLFEPISINVFIRNFKLPYDTIGINEGEAIWLLNFSMKMSASTELKARLASKGQAPKWMTSARKSMKMTTFFLAISYLLYNYATDEITVAMEDDITVFTQPSKNHYRSTPKK